MLYTLNVTLMINVLLGTVIVLFAALTVFFLLAILKKQGGFSHNSRQEEERREQVISIISHQLRTPLSIVKGYLEALEDGDRGALSDTQREYVSEARNISDDMVGLVNKYVQVLNAAQDDVPVEKQHVNLNTLVTDVGKRFQTYAKASNVEIAMHLPDAPITLDTDPNLLRSIIQTLMQNSMKYSVGSGTIQLTLSRERENITIAVADDGVGIPKDQQQEVFKKFFRGRNILHRSIAGSGLGLFIAQRYAYALGGSLSFTSEEGKGTTMRITLHA